MLKIFMITSFIVSAVLNLLYRINKKNKKDSYYSTLITLNLIGIALEIALSYFMSSFESEILINSLLARFYLLYLMISMLFFTLNLFSERYKNSKDEDKYYHKIKNYTYYFFYIVAVGMLFLPINLYEGGKIAGQAIDIVYFYFILTMVSWLVFIVKNVKTMRQKSFIPYGLYIIVFAISILLGWNIQSIKIEACLQLYVLLIIPFTRVSTDDVLEEEATTTEKISEQETTSSLCTIEYDPVSMIEELVENTRQGLNKSFIELNFIKDESVPKTIEGDLLVVRNILSNIIGESIAHMQIGKLNIKLDTLIRGTICKLIVTVENDGGGYKDEDFSHIFDPSQNTQLSTAKDLVEKMGGKLVSINESGIGTKFIFAVEQNIKL